MSKQDATIYSVLLTIQSLSENKKHNRIYYDHAELFQLIACAGWATGHLCTHDPYNCPSYDYATTTYEQVNLTVRGKEILGKWKLIPALCNL